MGAAVGRGSFRHRSPAPSPRWSLGFEFALPFDFQQEFARRAVERGRLRLRPLPAGRHDSRGAGRPAHRGCERLRGLPWAVGLPGFTLEGGLGRICTPTPSSDWLAGHRMRRRRRTTALDRGHRRETTASATGRVGHGASHWPSSPAADRTSSAQRTPAQASRPWPSPTGRQAGGRWFAEWFHGSPGRAVQRRLRLPGRRQAPVEERMRAATGDGAGVRLYRP